MGWLFFIFAVMTMAGAVAAVALRQLIHGALSLAFAFLGLALLYLQLGAQFIGLAQILVYIGAVAILVVFAILLTRGVEATSEGRWSRVPVLGWGIAGLVFLALMVAVLTSSVGPGDLEPAVSVGEDAAVIRIGLFLMTDYVVPLVGIGLLLTVALIGAVLIAMEEAPTAMAAPTGPKSLESNARTAEEHGKEAR
jgi:NADH-quinone oxidoreductase subunit J